MAAAEPPNAESVVTCDRRIQKWDTQGQRPYLQHCTLPKGHDGWCDADGELRIDGPECADG